MTHLKYTNQIDKKIKSYLSGLDLSKFPIKIEIDLMPGKVDSTVDVKLDMLTTSRDSNEKINLIFVRGFKFNQVPSQDVFLLYIRNYIAECILHELDEHLIVNKIRVFDPHNKRKLIGSVELSSFFNQN